MENEKPKWEALHVNREFPRKIGYSSNPPKRGKLEPILHILDEDRERFWRQVEKTDTWWVWKGIERRSKWEGKKIRKFKRGFGIFTIGRNIYRIPRVAWFMKEGKDPGTRVIQKCRNHLCVNPEHLSLLPEFFKQIGFVDSNAEGMHGK